MADYSFISVGIDFGVSTSGVSYCIMPSNQAGNPVTSILLRNGSSHMEPSELGASGSWGSGIHAHEKKFDLFKLSLLHCDDLPRDDRHPERLTMIMQALDKIHGAGFRGVDIGALPRGGRRAIDVCDLHFVFGIPAVWNEVATLRMRQAIDSSGILTSVGRPVTMDFVVEPEAAAIAIIPQLCQSDSLMIGHTIVICDCGGGTVDVISYKVTSLSPIGVKECVPGEGRLLGSMFLRPTFEAWIKTEVARHLGADREVIDIARLDSEIEVAWTAAHGVAADALGTWSHWMRIWHIGGDQLPPLQLAGTDVIGGLRILTDDIMALTETQVQSVAKHLGCEPHRIVVVGGFGCNRFLQSEFVRRFGQEKMCFTNLEGMHAVKNGAALTGLWQKLDSITTAGAWQGQANARKAVTVRSRVSPYSYGFWDGTKSENEITWFIRKGDEIAVGSPLQIVLPARAFKRQGNVQGRDHAYVRIYRVPMTMPMVSTTEGTPGLTELCHVRCFEASLLDLRAQVQLGIQMKGRLVKFDVIYQGVTNPKRLFEVHSLIAA
ncbi:hypothetical protein MFIFM68171_02629 [Madurella fahalii]|uniref:Actin-like ATPase domain-containing protein n=1 Tax=Madurella fahalii TaxID=1157608 RepID=A0ABQ0G434_9PEZI